WSALRRWYGRAGRLDLGLAVELGDVVVWTVVIYLTGAERSLLLFLVVLRAADMRTASFRRILLFGHFSVACYACLLLYVAMLDRRLDWPAELVKVGILYAANLYLAYTSKAAEVFRARSRRARTPRTSCSVCASRRRCPTPWSPTLGGCGRSSSTSWATPSSSPTTARSSSWPPSRPATPRRSCSISPSGTRASGSPPSGARRSSKRSPRPTAPPRARTAAPGSGSPSPRGSPS